MPRRARSASGPPLERGASLPLGSASLPLGSASLPLGSARGDRWLGRLLGFALVLPLVSACGSAQIPAARPAELRVIATPETATVYLDERFLGAARVLAVRPKRVPQGRHRLTVQAPGHFPHDLELELKPGETKIEIALRPIPY